MFGRIAFCNTVSDLYAMGITNIQEVLMILGVSTQMNEEEKDVSTTLMIQGFTDAAVDAQTQVGGGQTVYNMWPMMGGAAVSVVKDNEFVMPNHAVPGDKIILTKPLGTRLAINAMQWLKTSPEKKAKITQEVSES
jgi:selenide,water dikinase